MAQVLDFPNARLRPASGDGREPLPFVAYLATLRADELRVALAYLVASTAYRDAVLTRLMPGVDMPCVLFPWIAALEKNDALPALAMIGLKTLSAAAMNQALDSTAGGATP